MRTTLQRRGGPLLSVAALLLILLLPCAAGGCGFFSHPGGEHRLTVLYFGDLHGHLLPPEGEPEAPSPPPPAGGG